VISCFHALIISPELKVRHSKKIKFPSLREQSNSATGYSSDHHVAAVDVTKDVKITSNGVPVAEMIAGTYTDTVTFTIAVN
jgi:hypothetical protein